MWAGSAAMGEGGMTEKFLNETITLHGGDNRDVLKTLADSSIDSVVTDPPYALVSIGKRFGSPDAQLPNNGGPMANQYNRVARGFMGKQWDTGETAFAVEFWQEIYRVLKPGGHVVAFSGTRTYHRMACAIEDAGFEIRDMLQWLYGSGFPKSHDVSKGIDRAAGAEREIIGENPTYRKDQTDAPSFTLQRNPNLTAPATDAAIQWQGWGTALKPACEPICLARKPLIGTVAANVLAHGTGALNINGTRIGTRTISTGEVVSDNSSMSGPNYGRVETGETTEGRWPANVLHDGSEEVLAGFPNVEPHGSPQSNSIMGGVFGNGQSALSLNQFIDSGSAARFFYTAKADAEDRSGSKHPTIKPVDLIQWLVRLVTPKGGTILDPFAGSGSTGEAAWREGMKCVLIEREEEYLVDIRRRLEMADQGPVAREHSRIKASGKAEHHDSLPLFGGGVGWGSRHEWQRTEDLRSLRGSRRTIGPIGLKR
jgi:DNA modification methylase